MDVNERLYALARQAGGARRYLLMQTSDAADAAGDRFQQMLAEVGLAPMPVKIHKLPAPFWPVLIALDLDQGTHSALSALAVDMAIADTASQAMEHGQIQRTCAWIFSNAPVGELARHLATTAIARHLPSHKARWLRYYDPLVADLFWQACAPEQLAYFLRDIALPGLHRSLADAAGRVPARFLCASGCAPRNGVGASGRHRGAEPGLGTCPLRGDGHRPGAVFRPPPPPCNTAAARACGLVRAWICSRGRRCILAQPFTGTGRCRPCWTRSAPAGTTPNWRMRWTMPTGRGIAMETGNFLAPSTQERMTP